jgi:hypothetical protein
MPAMRQEIALLLTCLQTGGLPLAYFALSFIHSEVKSEANEQARNQFQYSHARSDQD